ncbi:tRNA1Val (adenine37-N6)-methyltransferase [Eubacterium ruminantium]|nr:tRNA1Val (adenine37-N6)-methyltransferase [Eubacterium ruminantium]
MENAVDKQNDLNAADMAEKIKALVRPGERVDDLQCGGFLLIQNPEHFCFGTDAVLLANFASGRKSAKAVDLGTGTGIIPVLMLAKDKAREFTALEIQEEMAEMAGRSAELNSISERMHVVKGDIKDVKNLFPHDSFDIVTSNPPYIVYGGGYHNPEEKVNIARHEILVRLEDVVSAASYLLKGGGRFAMVHKPFRLGEIIYYMQKYKIEPKRMQLVQPKEGCEANMVLIEGVKSAKSGLKVLPTINVYNADGSHIDYGKL